MEDPPDQAQAERNWRHVLRLLSFIVLHCAGYASNILTMFIVSTTHHVKYLSLLIPVHLMIGLFCAWTAKTSIEWDRYNWPPFTISIFIFVVLGLMQGIQVKLACDDFGHHTQLDGEDAQTPTMTGARFHCKAMDGILEATVFAAVSMYTLLKHRWLGHLSIDFGELVDLRDWQIYSLYVGSLLSFLTVGLALLEVDNRTSASVHRVLGQSNLARMKHLVFRASECALRLLTIIVFCTSMRAHDKYYFIPFLLFGADYLMGSSLLMFLGGKDPVGKVASFVLGIPLLIVNCIQFVDAPGMSLQARWISSILVPFRTFELAFVLIFCSFGDTDIKVPVKDNSADNCYWEGRAPTGDSDSVDVPLWEFFYFCQFPWLACWIGCGVIYYLLLITYAMRVKPEADIHIAVANGELDTLKSLLCDTELVLDVNRYGPNGRTPLHLAASQGQVQCMRLLVEQNANVHSRTGDRFQNTALHLAAKTTHANGIRYLCRVADREEALLNATNIDGDTALHLAVKRQNIDAIGALLQVSSIDMNIQNKQGQTPVQCIPQRQFGFDRESEENTILALFAEAQVGHPKPLTPRRASSTEQSVELCNFNADNSAPLISDNSGGNVSDASTPRSMVRKNSCAAVVEANVPLVNVPQDVEDKYFKRTESQKIVARNASAVTNCGISSFMLSAGMGALSKAFLNSMQEEEKSADAASGSGIPKAKFEDFAEIKKLGEGAFGKVTLVRYSQSDELFAMKIMNKAMFRAQRMTSKAISEQYILKTSRHPFIVGLNYAFQGSTFWALVMDYCPNGDLHDELVRVGKPGMQLKEVARLAGQTLLALGHLHKINVIFRDLKLENVILDANMTAKLTDFGLAKKLDPGQDAKTQCGSYGYAAPEIMIGGKTYTKAVDLYSFGVMLYMMLSGGDKSPSKPNQRVPPMKHSRLRQKLKEAKNDMPAWATSNVGAMELVDDLTSEKVTLRGTSTEVGKRRFFVQQLGASVDSLLEEYMNASRPGSVVPPQKTVSDISLPG